MFQMEINTNREDIFKSYHAIKKKETLWQVCWFDFDVHQIICAVLHLKRYHLENHCSSLTVTVFCLSLGFVLSSVSAVKWWMRTCGENVPVKETRIMKSICRTDPSNSLICSQTCSKHCVRSADFVYLICIGIFNTLVLCWPVVAGIKGIKDK